MTFVEKYNSESTWQGKVLIMGIFHNAMSQRTKHWTITHTAQEFGVSTGLVSENLRLADLIDKNPTVSKIKTRQEALRRLS